MSTYCGERETKFTFEAAEHWRENALLGDGSVFGENSVWTLDNFKSLDQYFINQLDGGEGNFFEKLSVQLAQTSFEVKQLAAELLWAMFLCPSNIGAAKKREGIRTIWEWSEEPFPEDSPWLKDAVLAGVGSAGTSYNTNRWRELVFIIRVMIAFKQLELVDRENLLGDGWGLGRWLERIEECNSRQFRHMMLFLLFPDDFERIFGGTDRRRIVVAFSGKPNAQISKMTALEIDKMLADIRKEQVETYDINELDFYQPPLRDCWGSGRSKVCLLTWDPEVLPWDSLAGDCATTHRGQTVTRKWNCNGKNVAVGDKVYLSRISEPKGIMAVGNVMTAPYEAAHDEEVKAESGKVGKYVDIEFTRIQNPLTGEPYLSSGDLSKIIVDKQEWFPQVSGMEIKLRSAGIVEKLWKEKVEGPPDSIVNPQKGEIGEATNQIFYGPPGTGKTYALTRMIERYSSKKKTIGRDAWLAQQLLEMRWFDVIFAVLYDMGAKAKVKEIVGHEFVSIKARVMGRHRNVSQTVWATLQAHTIETSQTVQYSKRSAPFVFDKDTSSNWHLVDELEDECMDQVEMAKALRKGPPEQAEHQRYVFVTFHQAYSYEDFVEGIRPVQDEENGEVVYSVVPGVFQRIALKAKADPGQRYAIFIDEINRGNIAKIFGELITLVECDKRAVYGDAGEKLSGMELTLPYSREKFGVPKNLDVYGSMNTADRSISLLDTALRRRFIFKELMPDAGLISGSRGDGYIEDGDGGVINLRALLKTMNSRIRFLLNRDMTLGHAYFISVRDFPGLQSVLLDQVIPLLQEYFYEDWHRIQLVFRDIGPAGEKLEPQIVCHETMRDFEILGFEHDEYDDLVEYRIADREEITPESIRKIYEGVS